MKKLLFFSLLACTAGSAISQSLDDINGMVNKKMYPAAKAAIDKYTADPKNAKSYEALYFKGFIYNAVSKDPATAKTDVYNYKSTAFDAFKMNQQLDKLDLMMKQEFYNSYADLYLGFYDLGAQQFNDKDYEGAYKSFSKAQEIENFILAKNYTYKEITLNKLDTGLVMNTAAAALQSKDTSAANLAYLKIVNAGITGKDYEQVYQYLTGYYSDHGDDANLQPLLTKAKAAYPTNNYWNELEISKIYKSGDKAAIMAYYEKMYAADPSNFNNTYNYGVELYNNIYVADPKDTNPATKDKLSKVLGSLVNADKGIDANLLMANHLFNWAADYSSEAALIKGKTPADLKKKKDLTVLADAKMDETIVFAEKVIKYFTDKTPTTTKEKINYQTAVGYMADIYNAKANPKKAAEYDKMRDAIKF